MADSRDIIVEEDGIDCRLSTWIKRNDRRLTFNSVNTLCRKGLIKVNGIKAQASYRLVIGDVITLPSPSLSVTGDRSSPKPDPKLVKLLIDAILLKDNHLIALNKPEGLASQGGSSQGTRHIDAYKSTLQFGAKDPPRLIHRLDKETSGILLLARDVKTASAFATLFRDKQVEKIYWALVEGVPKKEKGILERDIGQVDIWKPGINRELLEQKKGRRNNANKKKALTFYRVVEKIGSKYAWLELKPATGRTHQLRIHCAELGNPIIGDRKYKSSEDKSPRDLPYSFKKLFLHARSVSFVHPTSKKTTKIVAPLPKHMGLVWKHFGWKI
ncbi:RluA family pseudouridine synthase [Paracoccaceae bacterium]|nr:RluA family pseudouridine synthase [Paracoccaceae bacterium]